MKTHNRRIFLTTSVACSTAVCTRSSRASPPRARVLETKVISQRPDVYHGWPTLALRKGGQLVLAFSGGRKSHVCPFGRAEMMRSNDNGKTWTWPETVFDSPIDDRDAGILETARGTLLMTTFTSLAYEATLNSKKTQKWAAERLEQWSAAHSRLSAKERQRALGVWMKRSVDGGITWSGRYRSLVNSPHGPIQLADGRLLYAGKQLWQSPKRVGVCISSDDGVTWDWAAEIPTRSGDLAKDYHELHAVECASGRIVVHIRNHNATNNRELLQCESEDGGKTWSIPHPIGVWGLPSHLIRLKDDRLLMSYGYRRKPFGNLARISDDDGRTWSGPLEISNDGQGYDLGYPSTVQLHDGAFLSVWYELMKGSSFAQLRMAHWELA